MRARPDIHAGILLFQIIAGVGDDEAIQHHIRDLMRITSP